MRPFRLTIVSLSTYPLLNPDCGEGFGGAEVQLYLLGKRLNQYDDIEVTYIVGDFGQPAVEYREGMRCIRSVQKYARPDDACETWLESVIRRKNKWMSRIAFAMRFILHRPDIIMVRTASSGVGKLRFWTRLIGAKLVYMIAHEIDVSGEYERLQPKAAHWYRYGIKYADLIIAQHDEQCALLRQTYGRDAIVMRSVYDVEPVNKDSEGFILWVGRCEDWKRPEWFIDCAKAFPDESFVMIAPSALGKESYQREIKNQCDILSNVTYIDYVPFHEINEYFRKAKVFLITSKYEGFPNTIIQAAKNKTPIGSFGVNPNDIMTKFDIGFYVEHDLEEGIRALRQLLKDKNVIQRKGEAAYAYAKEYHDIEPIARVYRKMFSELISQS